MRSQWFVAVAVLLAVLGAAAAFAQGPTGSLSGTVRDDSGVSLIGATLKLDGDAGSFQGQSADGGAYSITNIPTGTYKLTATAPSGYDYFTIESLTVGGDVRQDVTLRRNYADTRAGATIASDAPDGSSAGCGPAKLADSDQSTAMRTTSPQAGAQPRTFTVTLSNPLPDPEVRIDPGAGCSTNAASGLSRYDLLASSDGSSFSTVASGTFRPADAGRLVRVTLTGAPTPVRAVRLVARDTFAAALGQSDSGFLSIAELMVLSRTPPTQSSTPPPPPSPTPTPTPLVRYGVAMKAKVRPRRDVHPPFRFVARGKLLLPFTVPPDQGCSGKVRITATHDKRFAGGRLAGVSHDCTFVHDVPLRRTVLGSRGTARFTLRFQGSLKLKPTFIRLNAAYGPLHPPKPHRKPRPKKRHRPR